MLFLKCSLCAFVCELCVECGRMQLKEGPRAQEEANELRFQKLRGWMLHATF